MEFLNHLFEDRINEKMCGIYYIALLIALIRVPFSCKYANMHINYIWSGRRTLHTQVHN